MRNQGQLFFGGLFVFFGLLFLIGTVFNINIWAFCWPIGLILLGVWILLRPQLSPGTPVRMTPLGSVRRDGVWRVATEEHWIFVGDASFDLTRAEIPAGVSTLRLFGFVNDVTLIVPQGVGVAVSSTAFVTDSNVLGQKEETFVMPCIFTSDDYASAERKVRLEATCFVASIKVKRAQ